MAAPTALEARVDVVLPAYDPEPEWILDAVASCLRAADVRRVVVVDDGSEPAVSVPSLETGRVHVVRQENRGPSAARNAGLEHVEAPVVLFLDADDALLSEALAPAVAYLDETGVTALQAGRIEVLPDGGTRRIPPPEDLLDRLLRPAVPWRPVPFFSTSGLLVARAAFDGGLRFDESIQIQEDRDLMHRLARDASLRIWPEPLVRMRRHAGGDNLTGPRHFERRISDHLRLLERHVTGCADPEMRANWEIATRWLLNNSQKVGIDEPSWRALLEAMAAEGWKIPLKPRLRRRLEHWSGRR